MKQAKQEQLYDQLEMMSFQAVMTQAAHHSKKKLKPSDLFKRPTGEKVDVDIKNMKEEMEQTQEWLSQFDFRKGVEHGE